MPESLIGRRQFATWRGAFWGRLVTRPYMRARRALADALWSAGRHDEAVGHCEELLALDEHDNQGVRFDLVVRLLEAGRDEHAKQLFERYPDERLAAWTWARVLWSLRVHGDTAPTHAVLDAAMRANAHVARFLLAPRTLPPPAPAFTLGSREEAASAAVQLLDLYERTAGALPWLRLHTRNRAGTRGSGRARARRRE